MPDLLEKLERPREAILLGEAGGLLHMFGKASSRFLQANALGGINSGGDGHQGQENFGDLWAFLADHRLSSRLALGNEKLAGDFTDFIKNYKDTAANSHLLRLFGECHRATSSDEKGVTRRQQPIDSMSLRSPFGRVQRIDINAVDRLREQMLAELIPLFDTYLNRPNAEKFRKGLIAILRAPMSRLLGETREPANDVTLWAQSFGVASLFKPVLAAVALGKEQLSLTNGNPNYKSLKWRLFGIGWNGSEFTSRGRKPADVLARQRILTEIRRQLSDIIEVESPFGNLFYADLNGAFFTFPGIDQASSRELLQEIGPALIRVVRQESSNELWPFLTLSKPVRTLTAIAQQIARRDQLASAPCSAATLRIEDDGSEVLILPGPVLQAESSHDVCPTCRVRSKTPQGKTCEVCRNRRSGRQAAWQEQIDGESIWVNEIADEGNRLALLTVRINLEQWLNGVQFTSFLSQTPDEWKSSNRRAAAERRLREASERGRVRPDDPFSLAAFAVSNQPPKTECKPALEAFMEDGSITEPATFFRELEDTYGTIDANSVLAYYFTQNPSPGRLSRVVDAADDFADALIGAIRDKVFASRPTRISFTTPHAIAEVGVGRTYRVTVDGVPEPVVVLAQKNRRFLSADNLAKFGAEALKKALREKGVRELRDEETGEVIHSATRVEDVSTKTEYLPFTTISRSPGFSQILLPADRVADVLGELLDLQSGHFGKVAGRLSLNVGIVVAKRKFPLYSLIEAGQKIVNHPSLRRGSLQAPWFSTADFSDFNKVYPTTEPGARGNLFSDLAPVEEGRKYWLEPGHFDFDFLGGTVDTQRLRYTDDACRHSINYGWLHPRPVPLFRLGKFLDLYSLLQPIGSTQRRQLGSALATKLEEWKGSPDRARPVYAQFANAVLQDVFTPGRWAGIPEETKRLLQNSCEDGLLLDTIELFDHVLKGGLSAS